MGLQEEIKAIDCVVDVLSRRRDELEFLGMGIEADEMTDVIEGLLRVLSEWSV